MYTGISYYVQLYSKCRAANSVDLLDFNFALRGRDRHRHLLPLAVLTVCTVLYCTVLTLLTVLRHMSFTTGLMILLGTGPQLADVLKI